MSIEKIHSSHTNTWPSSICSQAYLAVRNIKYFVHGTMNLSMLNWVSACLQIHAWDRFALSWKDESLGEWLKIWRDKIFALPLEPFYTIRLIAVISGLGVYITCSHGWSCLLNNLSLWRWYNTNAWRCVASFLNFHYFAFPYAPTLARCVTSRYGIGFQEVLYSIYVEYQENITWLFKFHGGQSHTLSTQSWSFPFVGQGINRSMTDPSMLRLLSWSYADLKFPPAAVASNLTLNIAIQWYITLVAYTFVTPTPTCFFINCWSASGWLCAMAWVSAKDLPVHSAMLSIQLFLGLPLLRWPSTVPCSRLSAAFFPSSWVDRSTGLHLSPNSLTS